MISCDNFLFIHRGFEKTLLFLPGWAFDHKIFKSCDLPFNYVFPLDSFLKKDFFEDFFFFIRQNKISSLSVLGWSMGGFFVADLLKKIENILEIQCVYLLNIRSYFNESELDQKINKIKTDKINALKEFYKFVFLGHSHEYRMFKSELEGDYINRFSEDELINGLNYLRNKQINLSFARNIKTIVIHGSHDRLVLSDMRPRPSDDPSIFTYVFNTGHLSFFSKEFKEMFSNCHVKKI
jgi:hypothetical protein